MIRTAPPRRRLPGWVLDVPLAHRGLFGPGVPENSLAAFAAARDADVGVELDVHVTADRVPVVVHDPDPWRSEGLDLDVRHVPVAAVRAYAPADGGLVPTLDEVLGLLGDTPVMVEVKNLARSGGTDEPAIAEVLDRHPGARVVVASFHPGSLRWFRRNRPGLLRAQTAAHELDPRLPRPVARALRQLWLTGWSLPHLLSYDVHALDAAVVRRWREHGGAVVCWTVRTPGDLALARAGADNLVFEGLPPADVLPAPR